MSEIRQQLKELGLERLASAIQAQSRPSLRLTAGKPSAQPVSRLGGRPNLPKDIPWPVWQEEQPLSFTAQLDLATLPRVRGLPLPRTGLREPHRDLDEEVRFEGVALAAAPEISLPGKNSKFLRDLHATYEEFEAYWNLIDPRSAGEHRMGGNANEIQNELGLEAQLVSNGIYCGGEDGYKEGRRRGLDAGASDWLLLLQVSSEERGGMTWGDGGRIYFMIRKDELRRRRFENVHLRLQCT